MIGVEKDLGKAFRSIKSAMRQVDFEGSVIFKMLEALATSQLPGHYDEGCDQFTDAYHLFDQNAPPIERALGDMVGYLLNPEQAAQSKKTYLKLFQQNKAFAPLAGYLYAELLFAMDETNKVAADFIEGSPFKAFKFFNLFAMKKPWEYKLEKLTALISRSNRSTGNALTQIKKRRLVWLLDPKHLRVEVLEQTLQKNERWSKGRVVGLKRLFEGDKKLDYLTEQDREIIKGIHSEPEGWYGNICYSWNKSTTIPALVGHPLIFHQANPDVHLELIKAELELYVEEKDEGYHISLSRVEFSPGIYLEQENQHRYRMIEISQKAADTSQLISTQGLTVPKDAKEAILQMIQDPETNIQISADLDNLDLPSREGDITPCLQLLPVGEGLRISLWVRPFGKQGPYYHAGEGRSTLIAAIETEEGETRCKAARDLSLEKERMTHCLNHNATLEQNRDEGNECYLEEPIVCLELLQELEAYQKEYPLRMEWPKGQTFQLKKTLSHKDMRLSITSDQQWFEYDGEIDLDNGQVLQMQSLLGLLDQSQGRFIEIEKGQFIALTEQFKKQLEELRAISEENRIYHLNSASLRELTEQLEDVSFDDNWQAHIKRIHEMESHHPIIPSTLQAELRDYQIEGFQYLSRLAHWGIGACLADDMGLGKTVQSIALLLERAPQGPCLVVAPTSVCFNWSEELAKFAPTLNVHLMPSKEREASIERLNNMDVLICSYGLLVQTETPLIEKSWEVVILDEAQAIKNNATKRWKVASQLQGNARLALTGTPIENHLGELWSIFRFLNPGLLSTLPKFQKNFALRIEKYQDVIARRALKKIVQPYILRRLKSSVLTELPPKTEQTIVIEPTAQEMAFYEAVRKSALQKIAATTETKSGSKRFTILAEISKLRQACCHSSLVNGKMNIESSKIKTFLALLNNLKENHHKVLVFSQFVRYLTIIKTHLEAHQMSYQYLDGGTPAKERKKVVEQFQAGHSDIFLLSLKAGGTGLNLTAADYVIHLDPWWNPAVEDQASDRAHRIGQTRPVTIYRLIMQDSIEQKMINLHGKKRDMASDLLSGSDLSGKMSEKDLVDLIEV